MYESFVCIYGGQKRVSDPLELDGVKDDCEPSCGYWELNPGALQGSQVLLVVEPSLQASSITFLGFS